jgi:alpha-mannosidase
MSEGVELGSLKRAEDSDAWIVRLVETTGRGTTAQLRFGMPIGPAHETNLLEQPTATPAYTPRGQMLTIPMKPWEIKTIVIAAPK